MAARFKLTAGKHLEGKTRYQPGDIVTSEHDLAKLFGSDKFQYIDGTAEPPQAEKDRFLATPTDQPGRSASVITVPEPETASTRVKTKDVSKDSVDPKDFTDQFESAVQSNLVVHKVKRKYWVKEPNMDGYLNEDGLNKAQAIEFIDEYMDAE